MSEYMIEVRGLTKRYGNMLAADHVAFKVPDGSILGFLGPNGAGKSTTMKMLACFMPPTSGTAKVAGYDILDESLGVRKNLGYLPESCPLYLDMRVREYLNYRAKIKGVPRRARKGRIDYVLDRCGIVNVKNRIIGHLSKGYRQRVGLADALAHSPKVLILDEPTVGLDPMQIREVRKLIKSLAEEHTVLISTHILPEVEMVCDRVIIIRRGRIILSEKIDEITTEGISRLVVSLKGRVDDAKKAFGSIEGVLDVKDNQEMNVGEVAETELTIRVTPGVDLRETANSIARENNWTLLGLRQDVPTLEEIFLQAVIGEDEEPTEPEADDKAVMESEGSAAADTAENLNNEDEGLETTSGGEVQ